MADSEERQAQNGGDTGTGDDEQPDYYTQDNPKAEVLIQKYDLDGVLEEIQYRWELDDDNRWGIRKCGRYFNTQIVESVLRNQIHNAPDNYSSREIYELLDGDDDEVDTRKRTDIRNWFQKHGVDPDELEDDFIHYRTLFKYLKEVQEASSPEHRLSPSERRDQALNNIKKSRNRFEASIQKEIQRAQNAGSLPETDIEFKMNPKVQCHDCGTILALTKYIQSGCNCDTENQ